MERNGTRDSRYLYFTSISMLSSFTSVKDLLLPRVRTLPVGHALESAYITEVAKKSICLLFNITEVEKDITHITYAKEALSFVVTSASFANEIKNREQEILVILKKEIPQAILKTIYVRIG